MVTMKVISSTVATIGFEQQADKPHLGTLQVTYKDRDGNAKDTYEYYGVHVDRWIGLQRAQSVGHYVNEHIKANHQHQKVWKENS